MPKRIVVCFDGTWNDPDDNTNVIRIYRSILGQDKRGIENGTPSVAPQKETAKWYDRGVGTLFGNKLLGGITGRGLSRNVREGYKFLIDYYQEDDEIYIFGFSRGAFTARSLSGLIRKVGVLKNGNAPAQNPDDNPRIKQAYKIYRKRDKTPDTPEALKFKSDYSHENVGVKFLGVWDTVGALGIPGNFLGWFNRWRFGFHDTRLSGIIENAYHALAVDEHRKEYEATLWTSPPREGQTVRQVWFAGAHSDVGGGTSNRSLSEAALLWMQEKAQLKGHGLEFDSSQMPKVDEKAYLGSEISDSYGNFLLGAYRVWRAITFRGRHYRPVGKTTEERVYDLVSSKIANTGYAPRNPGLK